MENRLIKDKAEICQHTGLVADNQPVQLMRAWYCNQSFPKHSHEGFGVGVIERGALGFFYRGENVIAGQGMINLVNPDEIHDGHAAFEGGWQYRMFYFDAQILKDINRQITTSNHEIPFFQKGVIEDKSLANRLYQLHYLLEHASNNTNLLEKQSKFLLAMKELISRYADTNYNEVKIGIENSAVKRAIEYMQSHFSENISIKTLAAEACLSPYHFIRVFNKSLGMPPHAFLMLIRVNRAKNLLARRVNLTDVAINTGFCDQSHLNRYFKRVFGYTPGQLRNSVQYLK